MNAGSIVAALLVGVAAVTPAQAGQAASGFSVLVTVPPIGSDVGCTLSSSNGVRVACVPPTVAPGEQPTPFISTFAPTILGSQSLPVRGAVFGTASDGLGVLPAHGAREVSALGVALNGELSSRTVTVDDWKYLEMTFSW